SPGAFRVDVTKLGAGELDSGNGVSGQDGSCGLFLWRFGPARVRVLRFLAPRSLLVLVCDVIRRDEKGRAAGKDQSVPVDVYFDYCPIFFPMLPDSRGAVILRVSADIVG